MHQVGWLLGLHLESSLAGFALSLCVSILGRTVSQPALPPAGHPGILEYVDADYTPSWYIPDISPWKVLSSPAAGFFDGLEVVSHVFVLSWLDRCRT